MDRDYIWEVNEDEHGTVSVWNTKEEAENEMIRMAQDANPYVVPVVVESEDDDTAWCEATDEIQIRVQRQPVGMPWGWR